MADVEETFAFSRKQEEIPSEISLTENFPLKVTFLKAASGSHIFGYYTIENSLIKNPRIIFPNVGPDSLISNISSYSFTENLTGKDIGFFLINEGFSFNQNLKNFSDIAAGKNGRLQFVERGKNWRAVPTRNEQGELIWIDRYAGTFLGFCSNASDKSKNPVLLWVPDNGEVEILAGHIFHTIARDEKVFLNPDGYAHAQVYFDNCGYTLTLGFCELLYPEKKLFNDVRFKLHIGEDNFLALFPLGIAPALSLSEIPEESLSSAGVQLNLKDFVRGDILRIFGIFTDEDGKVEGTDVTVTNFDDQGYLLLEGNADKNIYEHILQHIRLTNKQTKENNPSRRFKLTLKTATRVFGAQFETIIEDKESLPSPDNFKHRKDKENPTDTHKKTEEIMTETKLNLKPLEEVIAAPVPAPTLAPAPAFVPSQDEDKENNNPAKNTPTQSDKAQDKISSALPVPSPLTRSERKTVLITGAARRIGKELALGFAQDGWNVIIHCNKSLDEARELAKEVTKYGVRAALVQADLADEQDVTQIFPQIFKAFSRVDALINNASIFEPDTLQNMTDFSFSRHMMINLHAPLLLMQAFASQFEAQSGDKGDVINITDAGLNRPSPSFFSYNLSKNGLLEATRLAALALAPFVRVNAVAPGLILPSALMPAQEMEARVKEFPLQTKATPTQIYETIKFIITTPSLTGQTITLDGGQYV